MAAEARRQSDIGKLRRLTALLLALAMSAAVFAGCEDSSDDEEETTRRKKRASSSDDVISTSGRVIDMYEDHYENIFDELDSYLPSSGEAIVPDEIYAAVKVFCDQLIVYDSAAANAA